MPFEVPEGWVLSTVLEVFQINPKNYEDDSTEAGFVPMANISDGFEDKYSYEVKPWKSIKSGFTHFRNGDIAVAKISPCLENRKSFVVRGLPQEVGAGTTELFIFRSGQIIPEYGLLFFKSEFFISNCVGTFNGVVGQQRVARNIIEEMPFPIPPIAEQAKIIQSVNSIFSMISEVENNQSALKSSAEKSKALILDLAIHGKLVPQDPSEEPAIELLKRINPAFQPSHNLHYGDELPKGWLVCHLADVCSILDSQRKPINAEERAKRNVSAGEKYPYYGATGQVGTIDDYLLDGSFILLGEDGAPFLDSNSPKAYSVSGKVWVNNHAHILSPKFNDKYLLYYLNSIDYRPYVTGSTRLKLTQEAMRRIVIALPPVKEQMRIVRIIDRLFNTLEKISDAAQ